MLSYSAIIDKDFFFAAFIDAGIEFAKALLSQNGLLSLGILSVIICRCTNNPMRAACFFAALVAVIVIDLLLNQYVFPKVLVPVAVSNHDVMFQTTLQTTAAPDANVTTVVTLSRPRYTSKRNDLGTLGGPRLTPSVSIDETSTSKQESQKS